MASSIIHDSTEGLSRATWGLIAIFAVLFFCRLSSAPLWYGDECRTAERAREFLISGKLWTVQENFDPDFHKPPLHYWLMASTLRLLGEGKLAIRFWTWVFAVGALVLSAFHARLLVPGLPLVAPLMVIFVGLYRPFVEFAQIGLLDAGLMFWVLGVLVCAELAQRDERWWLLAGLCAGLGSLYKVPLPFGIWLLWLVVRARDKESRQAMVHSRCLWAGLATAALLTAVWPVAQIAQHGGAWWTVYIREEGIALLERQNSGTFGLATYPVWLVLKWWTFGVTALLGVGWVLWRGRSFPTGTLAVKLYEVAVIATAYLGILSLFRSKSHRYELPVIPLFAVIGLAFFLRRPMSPKWRAIFITVGVLPLAIAFWPSYFKNNHDDLTSHISMAQHFGTSTAQADYLFIIDGVENTPFLLFFGKLHQPVYDMPAAQAVMIEGTWHGLISSCDWPALQNDAPGIRKIADDGRMVEFARD